MNNQRGSISIILLILMLGIITPLLYLTYCLQIEKKILIENITNTKYRYLCISGFSFAKNNFDEIPLVPTPTTLDDLFNYSKIAYTPLQSRPLYLVKTARHVISFCNTNTCKKAFYQEYDPDTEILTSPHIYLIGKANLDFLSEY